MTDRATGRATDQAIEPRHSRPLDDEFIGSFLLARGQSEALAAPLEPEDQVVQSMPDCSPTKWHLAHTSWFFETFLLGPHLADYAPAHPQFAYLFNSYYEAAGERHPRPQRGLLTRPTVAEVLDYRRHVTEAMLRLFEVSDAATVQAVVPLVELGIAHEQQHQELLLMDILNLFSRNPLRPAYRAFRADVARTADPVEWLAYDGGIEAIGHEGPGFRFDNEGPRHEVLLRPFRLASRAVTNGEWRDFIDDGGYGRPDLWLSDGWGWVCTEGIEAPLYWERGQQGWELMTLAGMQPLDPAAPVCHVSFYEADAFARWAGKRLPSEAEWEFVAQPLPPRGNFLGSGLLRPAPPRQAAEEQAAGAPAQLFGDVWEWTASSYAPYPGYRPPPGAVGEYNGKFMANQMVLRGGSCVTLDGHLRASYRNFFYPHQRWAFTGLRLAEDA